MYEKIYILFVFLTLAVLYLLYKSFTSNSTTLASTTTSSGKPIHAVFTNNLQDASPASAIAPGTAPIPKLKDKVVNSEAGAVLVSALNVSTATFTAPFDAVYTFDLTLEFANGRDAFYSTDFYTNAFGALSAYHVVSQTGNNKIVNTCRLLMQKGKTVQFRGTSDAPWGNYQSSLYITVPF